MLAHFPIIFRVRLPARLPAGSAFTSECVIQLYLTLVKGGSGRSVGRSVGGWQWVGSRVWVGLDSRLGWVFGVVDGLAG